MSPGHAHWQRASGTAAPTGRSSGHRLTSKSCGRPASGRWAQTRRHQSTTPTCTPSSTPSTVSTSRTSTSCRRSGGAQRSCRSTSRPPAATSGAFRVWSRQSQLRQHRPLQAPQRVASRQTMGALLLRLTCPSPGSRGWPPSLRSWPRRVSLAARRVTRSWPSTQLQAQALQTQRPPLQHPLLAVACLTAGQACYRKRPGAVGAPHQAPALAPPTPVSQLLAAESHHHRALAVTPQCWQLQQSSAAALAPPTVLAQTAGWACWLGKLMERHEDATQTSSHRQPCLRLVAATPTLARCQRCPSLRPWNRLPQPTPPGRFVSS